MARPRKEGMEYFPHDTDASSDEKIDAMRALFGNDGYAFYFILCERIYRTSEAELDVSKPVLIAPVVKKLLVERQKFDEMLSAAFELNLFDRESYESRGVLTSNGIKKRFSEVNEMRNRWRKNKEKAKKTSDNGEYSDGFSMEKTTEETPESKAKESKGKESKEDIKIYNNSNYSGNNPYKIFESNDFGKINEVTAQIIGELEDSYSTDWVCRAMKVAIKKGEDKKNMGYVEGILKSWKRTGHPEPWTIDQASQEQPNNVKQFNRNRANGPMKPSLPIANQPSRRLSEEERAELRRKAELLDAGNREIL